MQVVRTSRVVHRWLRIAGAITWFVIGCAFAMFFVQDPPLADALPISCFATAFLGFIVLFWADTSPSSGSRGRGARIAALLAESVSALAIAGLPKKPVGFIFLTLVAAQMAGLLRPRIAVFWILAQSAAMGWVYARIVPAWEAQSYIAVYLGFQAFSYMIVRAALNEAEARDDFARSQLELRAKDALLAESQRLADRSRIGQDLHDVLGHHLAAMSLNLEVASHLTTDVAKTHVDRARNIARELLGDVREVVTELRRENGYDLESALAKLAADMPAPVIHVVVDPAVRVIADPRYAEALIRCAQEAITNAARHSNGENLWIDLKPAEPGIVLSARDDGDGADRVVRGMGLNGLAERFERLGGRVALATNRGGGFAVTAWLP